jgi:hypothetical protein
MKLCRILLVLGLVAGLPSMWETLSFSWDATFQAPTLRYGPTHTNYHAFREFTLTLGAIAIMLWAMFRHKRDRTPELWATMALAAGFYYGGWWLPWPLFGLRTPTLPAELVHEAAALLSCAAVALAWRHFRKATT